MEIIELSTRAMHMVEKYGSKEGVREALESGKIGINPYGGGGTIGNIGGKTIAELRKWVGIEDPRINKAISLLREHGYTVTKG